MSIFFSSDSQGEVFANIAFTNCVRAAAAHFLTVCFPEEQGIGYPIFRVNRGAGKDFSNGDGFSTTAHDNSLERGCHREAYGCCDGGRGWIFRNRYDNSVASRFCGYHAGFINGGDALCRAAPLDVFVRGVIGFNGNGQA
ncbi:hypothetical protein SDC9_194952 [bioreactor metagenome]|uniref:Uncharacterized protein n=1 Tax=bioreactor metagenome TaxID=1076179 RepID=A0A645I892_9ZZZZ